MHNDRLPMISQAGAMRYENAQYHRNNRCVADLLTESLSDQPTITVQGMCKSDGHATFNARENANAINKEERTTDRRVGQTE